MTAQFDKDFLIDDVLDAEKKSMDSYNEWNDLPGPFIIEKRMTGTSRWSHHMRCVFFFNGVFYSVCYSVGATESQDEGPFEYDDQMILCATVAPRLINVPTWVFDTLSHD